MKIITLIIFWNFVGVFFRPQNVYKINCSSYYDISLNSVVFTKLDTAPTYIGGGVQLLKFIKNNLKLNSNEVLMLGKIHIYLIIDKKGEVVKAGVEKPTPEYLNVKIKKLFEGTNEWLPGKCNNIAVISKKSFPIAW